MIRKTCLAVFLSIACITHIQAQAQETIIHYLSGKDKDTTVKWDFMCTTGRNAGKWSQIPVPSCWEYHGFGTFYYGWEETRADESGYYRHTFKAEKSWVDQHVRLVFDASMTDTEVKLNGQPVGEIHQGGFYRFGYDITDLLRYGKDNLLEVKVTKHSANDQINDAERRTDFWLFGGIYRPVWLEIKPRQHIESIAVHATADGLLQVRPYTAGLQGNEILSVSVETLDGQRVSDPVYAKTGEDLFVQVASPQVWSQEKPALYRAVVELRQGDRLVHRVTEKFGFRTIEFRPQDGFYLNGERLVFKGVNRHCFWPESGRTLNRQISLEDALLIKSMNMNAVRMSHYPPDKDFLEICDSLGLLVIDEMCSWQKKYDVPTARRLAKATVERDRNHPCIVIWANGNEGGWNAEVDEDFYLHDLQKRYVMHPWEKYNGTDSKHYPGYNYMTNSAIYGKEVFFPTEILHGNYDGGAGAGMADYWDMMLKHRYPAGFFFWVFADEGVRMSQENGRIDTKEDLAPDGIVGPYREKEASYYTIKEIWSPIQVKNRVIPSSFDGRLVVENNYMFTDLRECTLSWQLGDLRSDINGWEVIRQPEVQVPPHSLAPGERRSIPLGLPEGWQQSDVFFVTARDPQGYELFTWSWPIGKEDHIRGKVLSEVATAKPIVEEGDTTLTVRQGDHTFVFRKSDGLLDQVVTARGSISLSNGPIVFNRDDNFQGLHSFREGDICYVELRYDGKQWLRWCFEPGMPARLDYSFEVSGEVDYIGIGFDYPEEKIRSMEWIGRGPYRVWKNRLQGMEFGAWSKAYNNAITGEVWEYPEFKGYHADCRRVTVHTGEGALTLIPSQSDLFFQMLQMPHPQGAKHSNTVPAFPDTSLGFMHAIPAIGTRFQQAEGTGPTGQKNMQLNYVPFRGSLWFVFE
ncbi:MAG: glycoside hydrolase family 2 [Bacteroides sp.]|nr:glycoside hydrolase family 2 [Bacteroides sp.]